MRIIPLRNISFVQNRKGAEISPSVWILIVTVIAVIYAMYQINTLTSSNLGKEPYTPAFQIMQADVNSKLLQVYSQTAGERAVQEGVEIWFSQGLIRSDKECQQEVGDAVLPLWNENCPTVQIALENLQTIIGERYQEYVLVYNTKHVFKTVNIGHSLTPNTIQVALVSKNPLQVKGIALEPESVSVLDLKKDKSGVEVESLVDISDFTYGYERTGALQKGSLFVRASFDVQSQINIEPALNTITQWKTLLASCAKTDNELTCLNEQKPEKWMMKTTNDKTVLLVTVPVGRIGDKNASITFAGRVKEKSSMTKDGGH